MADEISGMRWLTCILKKLRCRRGSGFDKETWEFMTMHPVERRARMLAKVYGGVWQDHARWALAQLILEHHGEVNL